MLCLAVRRSLRDFSQYENRKDVYITNFWASVDWARVATRYAEVSGDVVPDPLPSPER